MMWVVVAAAPLMALAVAATGSASVAGSLVQAGAAPKPLRPVLAPIGAAEIVWNQTADACPYQKWVKGVARPCEEPDSMPDAWHNPLTNTSYLISATDCTYPTIGPNLSALTKHDCSHSPYTAVNDSHPWSYANHQCKLACQPTHLLLMHASATLPDSNTATAFCCLPLRNGMGMDAEWIPFAAQLSKTLVVADRRNHRHTRMCIHTPSYTETPTACPSLSHATARMHAGLQSTRVFPNGSGFAFVHNEFHGEQEHNKR